MSRGSTSVAHERLSEIEQLKTKRLTAAMQTTNPILRTARGSRSLILLLAIPAVLIASWLWGPTRASWDSLDLIVFRSLNGTLTLGPAWQKMWAFGNSQVFDAIAAMVIFALVITSFLEQRVGKLAIVSLGLLVITVMIGREIGSEFIVDQCYEYHRLSPSLVHADSQRLSQLVPGIECKDSSPWSFPGDHGMVALSVAIYVSFWSRKRTARAAWLLSVLLLLPRFVAGAHWLTDVLIGSLSMAMVSVGLLMGTGFHDWVLRKTTNLFASEDTTEATALPVPATDSKAA